MAVLLNNIVAHGALCADCALWLFDGKQVELGLWAEVADVFVGPDMDAALRRARYVTRARARSRSKNASEARAPESSLMTRLRTTGRRVNVARDPKA